jgi:hypothetical protein
MLLVHCKVIKKLQWECICIFSGNPWSVPDRERGGKEVQMISSAECYDLCCTIHDVLHMSHNSHVQTFLIKRGSVSNDTRSTF